MTCTKPLKAITLPCPICGSEDASVAINLASLDDEESQFSCHECDSNFGRARLVEIVRRWTKVIAWMELAPDVEEK